MKILYVTFPDKNEAEAVAAALVSQKLIACANIFENISSIYMWEDELKKESECVAIFKTADKSLQAAMKELISLHSYECPCVLVFSPKDGNKGFIEWVEGGSSSIVN